MNNIETMKLALEALGDVVHWYQVRDKNDEPLPTHNQNPEIKQAIEAITSLRQAIEQAQQAEQMELPEPRLTGTFSIRAGKFRCTGCTGSWTNKENAKQHSCKDYQ